MMRSRSLAVAAVAAAAGLTLLTGCQNGPTAGAAGSTPAGPTTETASPGAGGTVTPSPGGPASGPSKSVHSPGAKPGTPGTPGTQPDGVPVKRFATPNEAATYLVDAWRRGDRQAALRAAGPNTVGKMFAVRYVETPIDECTPQSGSGHAFFCYHRYEGGSTGFDVDPYPSSGYRVVNFTRTAD
ncbi:MAG: hypothetical protein JWL58_1932 [Streptosporangiaceae bacterium]|jgi:hypothetical protein|nr:hypothetical protein [Streptosporangiaceae bacterium]